MSSTFYFHPLASYCQKTLTALYELEVTFTPHIVDLAEARDRSMLEALWPMVKFPVLHDHARDVVVVESSLIIEYVDYEHRLLARDPDTARECRMRDRFFDLYVNTPMDAIVAERRRPADARDPYGVAQAHAALAKAYGIVESWMSGRRWALGESFSMADCAASSALHYAHRVHPIDARTQPALAAYHQRLMDRPAYARVLREAGPYQHMFPT